MKSIYTEQHKFQLSPQLISRKKSLRDINIPPKKLLTRHGAVATTHNSVADMFSDETFLQKYLPHNNIQVDSDDDSDPYSSDHFRMYEFKVRRCTRSRSHDWTDCPFAHPGEKARRRDPRLYHYSGTVCPEYRRGGGCCSRGDACEFSHGVFECWLHPARYRTEACKDGKNCKRKVCFFAHTPRQLRILPVNSHTCNSNDIISSISCNKKFLNPSSSSQGSNNNNHCLFCHSSSSGGSTWSPTSTLFGMSHFSPPLSPSSSPASPANGVSPVSRFVGSETMNHHGVGVVSYKDVLTELMCSLEGLNFGEANSPVSVASKAQNKNLPRLDASFNCEDHHQQQQQFILSPSVSSSFGAEDHQQQHQFILSPTITSAGSGSFSNGRYSSSKFLRNEGKVVDDVNGSSCPAPDLGWVNELLM